MEQQRGASLVEVLVTLLILKVGLLGALAGQLLALKMVTDASQRTTAVALSQDIMQQLAAFSAASAHDFVFPVSEQPPLCSNVASCGVNAARQAVLLDWQRKWQEPQAGYGLLFAPEFCIQQHAGAVSLTASWRQHAARSSHTGPRCAANEGRSALQLR